MKVFREKEFGLGDAVSGVLWESPGLNSPALEGSIPAFASRVRGGGSKFGALFCGGRKDVAPEPVFVSLFCIFVQSFSLFARIAEMRERI